MYSEINNYRTYIIDEGIGHLKKKFSGSMLGVFWSVANPVFFICLYGLIFSFVLTPDAIKDGDYILYLSLALVPWLIWSEGVYETTHALVDNGYYLKKVTIPSWVYIAKCSFAFFVYSSIAFVLVLLFALIRGCTFNIYWLLLPFIFIGFQLLAFSICLFSSGIAVFNKDFAYAMNILLQICFWSMPIVYFVDPLPVYLKVVSEYHLVFIFLDSFRSIVQLGLMPSPLVLTYAVFCPLVFVYLGVLFLKKLENEIRDVL